jgi:bifunctional non-homologous end joining protein LigD
MRKKYGPHTVEISNPDKLIFPKDKITKLDLIKYYEKISKTILPHIKGRPITMHRFPDGIRKDGFYQKNVLDYFPKWLSTVRVDTENGKTEHVLCEDKATLAYLANQACITPHVWLSKTRSLYKPDKLVFDLDPPNDDFDLVIFAAKKTKQLLDELNLISFVMTTGSSGLHVVVPLDRTFDFDQSRSFAEKVAKTLEKQFNDKLTTEIRKSKRRNRLFIDYLRNSYGQTSVAPYAVRAFDGAPVATPLDWHELNKKDLNSRFYNINNIFNRLRQKPDPWEKIFDFSKSLKKAKKKLEDMY